MSIPKLTKTRYIQFSKKEKTVGRSRLGPVNPRGHRTKHRPPLLRSLCCAVLRSLTHFFCWPFIENFYRASMFMLESNKITKTIIIFSVRHGCGKSLAVTQKGPHLNNGLCPLLAQMFPSIPHFFVLTLIAVDKSLIVFTQNRIKTLLLF